MAFWSAIIQILRKSGLYKPPAIRAVQNDIAQKNHKSAKSAFRSRFKRLAPGLRSSLRSTRGVVIARSSRFSFSSVKPVDIAIVCAGVIACTAPFLSPSLGPESTRLLTQYNPLAEREHIRAEHSVVITSADTPTYWHGDKVARAKRESAPAWAAQALQDEQPLPVLEALTRSPMTIELTSPPLWSRYIAGLEKEQTTSNPTFQQHSILPNTALAALPGIGPSALDILLSSIKISPTPEGARPADNLLAALLTDPPEQTQQPTQQDPNSAISIRRLPNGSELRTFDFTAVETSSVQNQVPEPILPATALTAIPENDGPDDAPGQAPAPKIRPIATTATDLALQTASLGLAKRDRTITASELARATAEKIETRNLPKQPMTEQTNKKPEITIILTAVGINLEATTLAANFLPREIAFALPPITSNAQDIAQAASRAGRAVLLEAPLQPKRYPQVNPGPMTLLATANPAENAERLKAALHKTPGAIGVATYLGGGFVTDMSATTQFVSELKKHGLMVLEGQSYPGSHLKALAQANGLKVVGGDIISIDDQGKSHDISAALKRLEALAKTKGHATAVAVAIPTTVSTLADWAADLERRGFALKPIIQ